MRMNRVIESAKGTEACRHAGQELGQSSGGAPNHGPVLRVSPKTAKGTDACRHTREELTRCSCGPLAPGPVLHVLLKTLARTRSGLALLSGIAAVLTGVERLLSSRRPAKPADRIVNPAPKPAAAVRTHYFRISRTKSEVGYSYWVLQGYGCFASFTLFDSWREAMDEGNSRLAAARSRPEWPLPSTKPRSSTVTMV